MASLESEPTAATARLMELAAEKRAAGYAWAKVAEALKRSADTVRKWPARYPELWQRLLRQAREQHAADAGAEALSILRTQLRHDDDKLVHAAAKVIIQHCPPVAASASTNDTESYVDGLDESANRNLNDALDAVDNLSATEGRD